MPLFQSLKPYEWLGFRRKVPNAPFYNCSGSSELTADECAAWQDVFDGLGLKPRSACGDSRTDPCACHDGAGEHQSVVYCKGGQIYSM